MRYGPARIRRRQTDRLQRSCAIGRIILRRMIERSWLNVDLAEALGCAPGTVTWILEGKGRLSFRMAAKIEAALDLPAMGLFAVEYDDWRLHARRLPLSLAAVRQRASDIDLRRAHRAARGDSEVEK